MKIQPVDFNEVPVPVPPMRTETTVRPVFKSRFKRLFERPFTSPLKLSTPDKQAGASTIEPPYNFNKDGSEKFEPSSIYLTRMVQNFIEGRDENHQQRCGRSESSDEEADSYNSSLSHACDVLKSLVPCLSVSERNLLAHIEHIVEKSKINKLKDGVCRKNVVDGLIALGYNSSICKSKWEKSANYPPGEHEYVDVITDGERLIVDIEFRTEFEIARSTKAYKLVLQTLPNVFVGTADRIEKIIDVASDAVRQSLKKKGMPFPPWRKADYVKAKWLSIFTRNTPLISKKSSYDIESELNCSSLYIPDDDNINNNDGVSIFSNSIKGVKKLEPLEFKPKSVNKSVKVIKPGLASIIEDNPQNLQPTSSTFQILAL